MKSTKITLIGLGASAIISGGIDVSVLNEKALARVEQIGEERVEAKQIGNRVETTFPWKDQNGLKVVADLGEPTIDERIKDKRKKEVITEVVDFGVGGFKVDILLNEKPDTNVFCYAIEGAENYDFFYQPPLTEKEIADGAYRPPEIEGSYAVYHKTLKNHVIGQENYATGKVMHIPRPEVWELNNQASTTEWADLSYSEGQLCVTVSNDYLAKANYPVRVDPTFGYTDAGASLVEFSFGNDGTIFGMKGSSISGNVSSINASIGASSLIDAPSATYVLYSSTTPTITGVGAVIFDNELISTSSQHWQELVTNNEPFSIPTSYVGIKGFYGGGGGSGNTRLYYDAASSTAGFQVTGDTDTYFDDPTVNYSVYATYTDRANLEQEGFAFGDDDGNESTHTLDSQDVNITAPLGTKTFRSLVVASSSASSTNVFSLTYQKNGTGGYTDIPIGAHPDAGAIEISDTTNSGSDIASTTWNISYPTTASGDLLIFNIAWDDSTTVTDVTAPDGPNGETAVVVDGPDVSASTAVRGKIFRYIATGSWTAGTLTFTPTAAEQFTATVIKVPTGEFDPSTPIGAVNALVSTTTSNPLLPPLTTGADDGGGRAVSWIASDLDDTNGTITGWTLLASIDRGATGGDLLVRDTVVTDSENIATSSGLTYPTIRNWVSFIYIVRPPVASLYDIYISPSANITTGGESTTARLTPPSGKTTGEFFTGRRWDDENGSDSFFITANYYTELEWVLTTQSPTVNGDYFDFRVYERDIALDTYSVTPRWTIGTPATGPQNPASVLEGKIILEGKTIFE